MSARSPPGSHRRGDARHFRTPLAPALGTGLAVVRRYSAGRPRQPDGDRPTANPPWSHITPAPPQQGDVSYCTPPMARCPARASTAGSKESEQVIPDSEIACAILASNVIPSLPPASPTHGGMKVVATQPLPSATADGAGGERKRVARELSILGSPSDRGIFRRLSHDQPG